MTSEHPVRQEGRSTRPGLPILPVVAVLMLAALLAAVIKRAAAPLGNTDTYFHLRFGQEFLDRTWSLGDPGSVTRFGTADWTPTQWLAQVAMAAVENGFGLAGVAWLTGAVNLAFTISLYLLNRRWSSPVPASVITIGVAMASFPYLSGRPQVLSLLFMVMVVAAWLDTRETARVHWWLVPLTWIWAMCHGMWPIGLVTSAGFALGLIVESRHDDRLRRPARMGVLVTAASGVAAALTPVGPALYIAVFRVSGISEYFGEWGPVDFHDPLAMLGGGLIGLTLLLALAGPRPPATEVVLLGIAGVWVAYSARTFPIALIMIAPLLCRHLQAHLPDRGPGPRWERPAVIGIGAVSLLVLALVVPRTATEPPEELEWAPEQLSALAEGTVVLDDWGEGGYLMWRYPDLDFPVSGYGDIYTSSELERNATLQKASDGWVSAARDTGATTAILGAESDLAYNLRQQGWTVADKGGEDDAAWVYLTAPDDWLDGSAG